MLQNAKKTTFTVSELLRVKGKPTGEEGGVGKIINDKG